MSMGLFRILGPVMVGPSSSHTAGAVRIGRVARSVSKGVAVRVKFYLHGSFRNTYKGHGTDRALAAGILGFKTDDERIVNALDLAKENGITIEFIKADLGDVHPNTVKVEMFNVSGEKTSIIASSIGGGEIKVIDINGFKVNTSCNYDSVIIKHRKDMCTNCKIMKLLKEYGVNLVSLNMRQSTDETDLITVLEMDAAKPVLNNFFNALITVDGILDVTNIEKV